MTRAMNGKQQRLHHGRNGRTAYHFQPAKNWMNDPSGPIYYNGMYHLFFEYNPHDALFGTCTLSWGHSVSGDLVNWVFLGTALDPTSPFDVNGCWSGSATVMPNGIPVILYTGRGEDEVQGQNLAIPKNPSDPLLREWTKPSWNPMIRLPEDVGNPALEPGPYQKNFRDPSTSWRGRDGLWRVAVTAEIGGVGTVLIYHSADFIHWERNAAPFYATPTVFNWECPDLFPVMEHGTEGLDYGPGEMHVFKLTQDKDEDYYVVGRYDDETDTFAPVEEGITGHVGDNYNWRRLDHGHVFGGKTFFDARKKRRVLWDWADEMDSRSDSKAKGWAGVMIVPRTLWLDTDGKQLVQWPVEEIETLRRKPVALMGTEIGSGGLHEIAGIDTLQADVEVVFEIPNLEDAERLDPKWLKDPRQCQEAVQQGGGVGPFGLVVMASGDMREKTTVFFRVYEHHGTYKVLMCVDLTRSSTRAGVKKPSDGGFVEESTREGVKKPFYAGFVDVDVKKDRSISLRTLIDHSIIESFGGGGRACFTARVYPEHVAAGASTHLFVFNDGPGAVTVSKLEAWEMATASVNVEDDGLIRVKSPDSPLVVPVLSDDDELIGSRKHAQEQASGGKA